MKVNRFKKNIFLYSLSTFSTKIIQLLFIPLYSSKLDTNDFGYYGFLYSIVLLLVPLLFQSIWEGVLRFTIMKDYSQQKIIKTSSAYIFFMSIMYTVVFIIALQFFNIQYGLLVLLMGILQVYSNLWLYSARAFTENAFFALGNIISSIVIVAFNFFLILFIGLGIKAIFISNIIGNICLIVVLEVRVRIIRNYNATKFDKRILIDLLKFSMPLSINSVSWWLISASSNTIISSFLGYSENGIFSIAMKFGAFVSLVTTIFTMAWIEEAFHTHGDKKSNDYFNRMFDLLQKLLFTSLIIIIPITYIIYIFFVHGDYQRGVNLTPLIYLSAIFSALASHLGSSFLVRKESKIVLYTSLISGIVAIGISIIAVNIIGLIGIAISMMFGNAIMFILRVPLMKKYIYFKFDKNFMFISLLTIILVSVLSFYSYSNLLNLLFITIVSSIIFLVINKKLIKSLFMIRYMNRSLKTGQGG